MTIGAAGMVAVIGCLAIASTGCENRKDPNGQQQSLTARADSMGAPPTSVFRIAVRGRAILKESSAAVVTKAQPAIVFTINDSGNEPSVFALDSAGNARGMWRVTNAQNIDWEALAPGPCATDSTSSTVSHGAWPNACLYIADTGDNSARRLTVTLYRVAEPTASVENSESELMAEALSFRYPDEPHDVEAIYTSRGGDTFLITKRPLRNGGGQLRPSLVFVVPASAWLQRDTTTAALVDSLPIFPGSSRLRQITDASLSHDSRYLAVRTYGQVFVFATDSVSGRILHPAKPAVCNIEGVEPLTGEGISWFGDTRELLLNSEGVNAPMHRITCRLPAATFN